MREEQQIENDNSDIISKYDKIFNSLNIGVFLYKTDKNSMKFLMANDYGCKLFNFENEKSFMEYDWNLPEVCHPEEVNYLFEEMATMNNVGDVVEHEYRLNRHNGTYVWVLCHQKVIEKNGEWLTILNSCTVIDEKKWAEEANAAKSTFLSNMSHDMRTPLNAIINMATLARDSVENPDRLLHDLGEIEKAGMYLLALINDVLDMSKIENRELSYVPCVYKWQEFVDYIDSIFVPLCEENGINFVWDKGPTSYDLWLDRTRFNQLFFNLLSNAAKYTNPGGTVTFTVTNNTVADGKLICDYIITDTGIGMSQEFQKKMFEPFEREERVSAYTGTGLGLAIVKEIVDNMGGTINVESKSGVGTTITVHLAFPLATEEQKKSAGQGNNGESDNSYSKDDSKHILIVEDNAINREILSRILKKEGYTVDEAVNGYEAVETISKCEPWFYRAILMDIRMPVMDGLLATRRIRKLESDYAKRVPIISMTASAYEEDAQNSISAGMNEHLTKPIVPNELYKTLKKYIN